MGFDVTLHPFSRKEYKFFIEDIVDQPYLVDTRLAGLHDKEEERVFLDSAIYERMLASIKDVEQENAYFEKTIGLGSAAILGYLHPYWYLRNGLLSKLMKYADFAALTSNMSTIVSEENKTLFDSSEGVLENYSSGVYLPHENIQKLITQLGQEEFKKKVAEEIGAENLEPLLHCLNYCNSNQLDLLEATDLCVPFSGESSTYAPNMKALHLKNSSDAINFSRKNIPEGFSNSVASKAINLTWWNNLDERWKELIRVAYLIMVRSRFGVNHSERNAHIKTKFSEKSLDLSELEKINHIIIKNVDGQNNTFTLTPLFDFPQLRILGLLSSTGKAFDLRRLLQFPYLEKLRITGCLAQNILALKELKHLTYLDLGKTGFKAADLKKLNRCLNLKSLCLAFAPNRSVSFLQGNSQLEALTLSYTKGLKNLPNLKRLHLFLKETKATIIDCPNIELIRCYNAQKMRDLSSFTHLSNLKTLFIEASSKNIDLSLLSEMTTVEHFLIDTYTNLESITPVDHIKYIYFRRKLDQERVELAKAKFPNAVVKDYVNPGFH